MRTPPSRPLGRQARTFIECKTVRWERHSAFSAGGTDAAAQREAWQRVDPIPRYRCALLQWGVDERRRSWRPSTRRPSRGGAVRAEAEQVPFPTLESMHDNIFAPVPGA